MKKSNVLSYIFIGVGLFLIVIFWLINGFVKVDYYGIVLSIYFIGYVMLGYGFIGITKLDKLDMYDIKRKKKLCKYLLIISLIIGLLLVINSLVLTYDMFNISIFMFVMVCFFSWHIWLVVMLFICVSLVRLNEIKWLSG